MIGNKVSGSQELHSLKASSKINTRRKIEY